jgi:alpha-ketoglutarate-dependent taurine dioxygenase
MAMHCESNAQEMVTVVREERLDCEQVVDGHGFPLALTWHGRPDDVEGAIAWAQTEHAQVTRRLTASGAILFRGFPITDAQEFDRFVAAFDYPIFTYEESLSNAVRINITPRVFTANEAPSSFTIRLHHEMAQTPIYPGKLFFYCEQAPEEGGATSLCRSDTFLAAVRKQLPEFAADCAAKGLCYSHILPAADDPGSGMGRSWRSTFSVDSRTAAEARMRTLSYRWEWLADGGLQVTTPPLPAVRTAPGGQQVFFNQLVAVSAWRDSRNDPDSSLCYGDGTRMDWDALTAAATLADEQAYDLCWQPGDVALVDNFLVMHGRRPFVGARRVLAAFAAA